MCRWVEGHDEHFYKVLLPTMYNLRVVGMWLKVGLFMWFYDQVERRVEWLLHSLAEVTAPTAMPHNQQHTANTASAHMGYTAPHWCRDQLFVMY